MGDPKKGTSAYDSKLDANNKRRNAASLKSTLQKPLVKAFVRKVLTRVRKNKDHEYEGMLIRSNNHMRENVGLKKKLAIEIARTTRVRAVVTKVDEKYKRAEKDRVWAEKEMEKAESKLARQAEQLRELSDLRRDMAWMRAKLGNKRVGQLLSRPPRRLGY